MSDEEKVLEKKFQEECDDAFHKDYAIYEAKLNRLKQQADKVEHKKAYKIIKNWFEGVKKLGFALPNIGDEEDRNYFRIFLDEEDKNKIVEVYYLKDKHQIRVWIGSKEMKFSDLNERLQMEIFYLWREDYTNWCAKAYQGMLEEEQGIIEKRVDFTEIPPNYMNLMNAIAFQYIKDKESKEEKRNETNKNKRFKK